MADQSRNLTWVIGDWRFYVALADLPDAVKLIHGNMSMERWNWNVRYVPIGWSEFGQTDGTREQAIIDGLNVIQALQTEQYETWYHVDTPALDGTVKAKPQMLIADFIRLAHQQLVGGEFDPTEWRLEGINGWDYPQDLPIGITRSGGQHPITLRPVPVNS